MSDLVRLSSWLQTLSDQERLNKNKLIIKLVRWACKRSFICFCLAVKPGFLATRFHKYVAWELQRFYETVKNGQDQNDLIEVQPQIGKSTLASELFPAWILGKEAWPIIVASYGASLAEQKSGACRDIVSSEMYQIIFPHVKLHPDSAAKDYWKTTTGGSYRAVGVGGGLTGMSGKILCLPAGEKIFTERGYLDIADIVVNKIPVKIWSFNHITGKEELKGIEKFETNPPREILELELEDGTKFSCTEDHPVFVDGKGYIPAKEVISGDVLLVF